MTIVPRIAFMLMFGSAAVLAGCRERTAAKPAVAPQTSKVEPRKADDSAPPVERAALTDRQVQAVDSITAAGGSIEKDVDGHVVGIDLASDRVVSDEQLVRAVLEFPYLRRLRLAVGNVPPETLAALAALSDLDELMLQDAAIDDAALAKIVRATPLLRRLTLRRVNQVTDAGLAVLADCQRLEVVALIEMSGITGAAVDVLRRMELLRSLDVRNCGRLTTADFSQLATLSGLSELKVGGPAVNDQVLGILATHPALTSLSVDDAQISPASLRQLAGAPELAHRLRSLAFARCSGVTDETLKLLSEFTVLESLALRDIMLTGSFLQYLQDTVSEPLPLKTLIITNALLTDESLTPLPGLCPALARLDLSGNSRLTDSVLNVLKQIQSLREVQLNDTSVTQKWFPQVE